MFLEKKRKIPHLKTARLSNVYNKYEQSILFFRHIDIFMNLMSAFFFLVCLLIAHLALNRIISGPVVKIRFFVKCYVFKV